MKKPITRLEKRAKYAELFANVVQIGLQAGTLDSTVETMMRIVINQYRKDFPEKIDAHPIRRDKEQWPE